MDLRLIEGRYQSIIFRKIVLTAPALSHVPLEIHPHPAKAGGRDHFHLSRFGIGEMNIYAQPLRDCCFPSGLTAKGTVGISGATAEDCDQKDKRQKHWHVKIIRSGRDFRNLNVMVARHLVGRLKLNRKDFAKNFIFVLNCFRVVFLLSRNDPRNHTKWARKKS